MKKIFLILALAAALFAAGCDAVYEAAQGVGTTSTEPSLSEMSGGMKDALSAGVVRSVNVLGASGGFLNNPQVRIPFPPEAQFAANTLRDIGLGKLVDDFEAKLNEGAEKAVKKAVPIFKNAITGMTFNDVKNILLGGENAATNYFKARTSTQLYNAFAPEVKGTLDQVGVTNLWTDITKKYNAIPLTNKKVETDLVKYATNKAMDGLFLKVAEEEAKIRKDPVKRTTALMRKVFDYASRQR
ncbi:MAG: DUF4197 domain-containing protein [Bacteroidota bacterium]